ncbi:MAG: HD domain-containing protein [Acidobacteria bacterium]|nr:HD domain-containing protein [Acidobacteriota bacterium]MCB9397398.1 HD domain-containing protein [Acidobacteriota bacterium]
MKTIRDPVHGDMTFSSQEMDLIDTPEFQRLRGIKQLGTSYLVFPGARHTRFEHSLGTAWLLKRMVREINEQAERAGLHPPIGREEAQFLAAAALLHDITHIPFGHTFEDERRILPPHDKNNERLHYFLHSKGLGTVLRELGWQNTMYSFFAQGKQLKPEYPYQLVAGPICADLLDYLRRDAFFCGLNLNFDDRIFKCMSLESGSLCFNLYSDKGFRQDAWSELIHLLRIRFHLTERVYFHHSKMVSGAMLSRVLEALLECGSLQREDLVNHTDDSLIYEMNRKQDAIPAFRPLLSDFMRRRLYKRVYMVARDPLRPNFPSTEHMNRFQEDFHMNQDGARTELERRLAKHLQVPISAVILYAPETQMRLKEAHIQVRKDASLPIHLDQLKNPELDGLRQRHQGLWRFFLFMSAKYEKKFSKAAHFLEEELGLPNQLGLLNQGQMTLNLGES